MCIRDRNRGVDGARLKATGYGQSKPIDSNDTPEGRQNNSCLLYTSDAADERSSVDLGGRRIIKKKKQVDDKAQQFRKKNTT